MTADQRSATAGAERSESQAATDEGQLDESRTAGPAGSEDQGLSSDRSSAQSRAALFPAPDRRWYQVPWGAVLGGLIAVLFSLTPTLVPRSGVTQGLVTGAAFTVGYGLGVLVAWIVRQFTKSHPDHRPMRILWIILGAVALGSGAVMLWWAADLQGQLFSTMGKSPPNWLWYVYTVVIAIIVAMVIIGISRLLRHSSRGLGRLFVRWMPLRTARGLGRIAVAVITVLVISSVLLPQMKSVAIEHYHAVNFDTVSGTTNPNTDYTSGGRASAISWDDLGSPGRDFISQVTTQQQLTDFSGKPPTQEPIRVYVGIEVGDPQERASAALADLKSMGAFDRKLLAVVTSTGTGWIDPQAVDPLEYMFHGDSAIVSTQYSILPSWMAVLVGGRPAQEAAITLFEAVYAEWQKMPADQRPKLVVFGESLGAEGAQAAFSGLADMNNRTDAALFVGPPNASEPWQRLVKGRDAGSPESLPIYQSGTSVRFAGQPADVDNPPTAWNKPRALYLMNASDPVVWFSPDLLFSEPDWMREPPGRGVLPELKWIPIVTFLQMTGDMMASTGYPAGFGHSYGTNQVNAWASIIAPPGWTPEQTEKLRGTIGGGAP